MNILLLIPHLRKAEKRWQKFIKQKNMKRQILLLIFFFQILNSFSQSYTYKKFDLDTSCFWVYDYYYYGNQPECAGEKIISVEKDTIIGTNTFYKLRIYTSIKTITSLSCEGTILNYFKETNLYVREDTINQTLVDVNNNVLIDYNLNVGDTLNIGLNNQNPTVDSATIDTINGIPRRRMWSHFGLGNIYTTIEGIGANMNFLVHQYGEWLTPAYRELKCYSKNGTTVYPDNSNSTCVKNYPVNITEINRESSFYEYLGRDIFKINSLLYPIEIQILDFNGRMLYKKQVNNNLPIKIPLDLKPIPILIIRLINEHTIKTYKLKIN
jgi:hypothetical protein